MPRSHVSSELRKRPTARSATLSTMSVRARAIATTGVLWTLLVGAAILTTVRRGGMKVTVGTDPRSTLGFERQYDFARLFNWIGVISAVALVVIVLTLVLTIRSTSRTTDEFEYEVVPSDRRDQTETPRRHLDLTA
jgi:hypothetical protein